jgi:hypothetical protein
MARETAKQRKEREAQEEQARLAQLVLEYPNEMMLTLARASSENMTISVSNVNETGLMFVVDFEDGISDERAYFGLTYTYGNKAMLDKLAYEFDRRQTIREAAMRRKELRATAMAKLTPEELEALTQ